MKASSELGLYLKQGDSYYWALHMAFTSIDRYEGPVRALIAENFFLGGFSASGISHVHLTYPENGEVHATIEYDADKRIRLYPDKLKLETKRPLNANSFPNPKALGWLETILPMQQYPAFSKLSPESFVQLVGSSGFALPIQGELNASKRYPGSAYSIFDVTSLSGSLWLTMYLSGNGKPGFGDRDKVIFSKFVNVGAMFYGFEVSLAS